MKNLTLTMLAFVVGMVFAAQPVQALGLPRILPDFGAPLRAIKTTWQEHCVISTVAGVALVGVVLYATNTAFRNKVRELLGLSTREEEQKGIIEGLEELEDLGLNPHLEGAVLKRFQRSRV